MKKHAGAWLAGILVSVVLAGSAFGAVVTSVYYLDENNSGLTGGPWASVTLSQDTSNLRRVDFVIDPIESAFTIGDSSKFGLSAFYFNESTAFGSALSLTNLSPSTWEASYSPTQNFNVGGGFGKFELKNLGSNGANDLGNPLRFYILAPASGTLSIDDFTSVLSTENYLFAAHIQGFADGEVTSAKFATDGPPDVPVPEPGTLMLLGSGLVGLAGWGRKRLHK